MKGELLMRGKISELIHHTATFGVGSRDPAQSRISRVLRVLENCANHTRKAPSRFRVSWHPKILWLSKCQSCMDLRVHIWRFKCSHVHWIGGRRIFLEFESISRPLKPNLQSCDEWGTIRHHRLFKSESGDTIALTPAVGETH
jgi:hypothetical protein